MANVNMTAIIITAIICASVVAICWISNKRE